MPNQTNAPQQKTVAVQNARSARGVSLTKQRNSNDQQNTSLERKKKIHAPSVAQNVVLFRQYFFKQPKSSGSNLPVAGVPRKKEENILRCMPCVNGGVAIVERDGQLNATVSPATSPQRSRCRRRSDQNRASLRRLGRKSIGCSGGRLSS